MSRSRTLVRTEILLWVGLLALVGGAYGTEQVFGLTGPVQLSPLLSMVLACVPGLLWLVYFYLQDRHEPEPKHYVLGVFLLGAFVAYPMAGFFTDTLFDRGGATLKHLSAERVVAVFLVMAVSQELVKYACCRYSIYLSDEFDEPLDGILYMTAIGIGYATAENYRTLQGLEGSVFLATGAANAVITTLAHACFAGVTGYALGRAKFDTTTPRQRAFVLLGGLALAILLNGVFTLLEGVVKVSGLSVQPWRALAWAAGFAFVVFALTMSLMQKHLDVSPHRPPEPSPP